MKSNATYKKWLSAAYHEFAENGPDFSLKALAKETGLPRATFYYHFLNKEELIAELLEYHVSITQQFKEDLLEINQLIPDLYLLLFRHKTTVQFHQQLLHNCHIPVFKTVYYEANKAAIEILLPHIKAHFSFHQSDEEVFHFYNTLTDAWYTRLDFNGITPEKMKSIAEEITGSILALYYENNSVKPSDN